MNIMQMMQVFQQLKSNPMQILSQRFNIPGNVNLQDPNAIIQHLLNSGQINQQQVNSAMSMRNNPMWQNLFKNQKQ